MNLRAALAVLCLAAFSLVAAGCAERASDLEVFEEDERSVEEIYSAGLDFLQSRNYYFALDEFTIAETQYPYSIWARRAILLSAYANYELEQYDEAAAAAQRFFALYPGNAHAPYAYYLYAMCFYRQIGLVDRQNGAGAALAAFETVVKLFPASAYARDARFKIPLVRAHLAARQMYLGRYHQRRGEYAGAIKHFQNVVRGFQTTAYPPEALHRLVEIYLTLGLDDEARKTGVLLGANFPASTWYRYSYALLAPLSPDAGKAPAPGG